ncbi:hypothetical protein ASB57_08160 [Bordetella sp. N]|nr:hypothetical protein ASB57_08160 [Bordetella sp. N]
MDHDLKNIAAFDDDISDIDTDYPQRSVSMMIGGPPGGGIDILARRLSVAMAAVLGQRVAIDYRLGASGNLAAMAVAQAKPDGYTILLGTRSATLHRTMYPHLQYDFKRDLTPVAMVARMPVGIVIGHRLAARTLREVIQIARDNPGRLNAATLGVGTTNHLVSVLLQDAAGIRFQHIPYMEMSRALTDVVSGKMDLLFTQLAGGISHMNAGSLRAVAVTSNGRVSSLPDVPTIAEEGFPEISADDWFVLLAPRDTHPAVIAKLNLVVSQLFADEELHEAMTTMGYVLPSSPYTPDGLRRALASDNARWTSVLRNYQVNGFQ